MNIRCTYSFSRDIEKLLNKIYIKRLESKNKMTRSAIVAEAIKLLWENTQWISVDERLPEENKKVIWFIKEGFDIKDKIILIAAWHSSRHSSEAFLDYEYPPVRLSECTHWMPLPESPKE